MGVSGSCEAPMVTLATLLCGVIDLIDGGIGVVHDRITGGE